MTLLDIPLVVLGVVFVIVVIRGIRGPHPADRVVATDLAFFVFLALVALFGARLGMDAAFDVILIGTLLGFVATLWMALLLTRGK